MDIRQLRGEMSYKIKIEYRTGNSFGLHDETDYVDYEWSNLDMAKKSLLHIKNHYESYKDHDSEYKKPEGKLPDGVKWEKTHRMIILEIVDDYNKPFCYSSFWTGYFETLQCATIVVEGDSDMMYKP